MSRKFEPNVVLKIKPKDLQYAAWNPKQRIDATTKPFILLVESLRELGQLMPILITTTGLIMEGNRRTAACEVLGIDVEAIARDVEDAAKIYDVVNNVRLSISGSQHHAIYDINPKALSYNQRVKVERHIKWFGGLNDVNEVLDSKWGTMSAVESIIKWGVYLYKKATPTQVKEITRWWKSMDICGTVFGNICKRCKGQSWDRSLNTIVKDPEFQNAFKPYIIKRFLKEKHLLPPALKDREWLLAFWWLIHEAPKTLKERHLPTITKDVNTDIEQTCMSIGPLTEGYFAESWKFWLLQKGYVKLPSQAKQIQWKKEREERFQSTGFWH